MRNQHYYEPPVLETLGLGAVLMTLLACAVGCVLLAACVANQKPAPAPTMRAILVRLCPGLTEATVQIERTGYDSGLVPVDENGVAAFPVVPNFVDHKANVHIRAKNFKPYDTVLTIPDGNLQMLAPCIPIDNPALQVRVDGFALEPAGVDPTQFSLEQLSHIRGAMWTAKLNLPYGPRPNADDNVLAFDFYQLYAAADRVRMIAAYKARGYTHVVTGPIAGSDCYHGLWPCYDAGEPPSQADFDAYLDAVQELWDAGLIPIHFAKPDGWEVASMAGAMDGLDALYAQPRAQRLLRVVVYPGWEPSGAKYGWSNAMYVTWVQRGARVFPNALRLLHLVSDLDAPTGQNDDTLGMTNGQAWKNVAPYIHGFLSQVEGYAGSSNCTPTPQFLSDYAAYIADGHQRFYAGRGGWPTSSAFGDGIPIRFYAGEYASFITFWKDCDESNSLNLGDLAVKNGADGYLDGGRVEVP